MDELKYHLQRAQAKMKHHADARRRDVVFSVGDLVYLELCPYRMRSLAQRPNEKLSPRFFGPFKVLRRLGQVAYELELPSSTKVHPVFHVSQLKPAKGTMAHCLPLPPHLSSNLEWVVELEHVLAARSNPADPQTIIDVLIPWKGLPNFEATWESVEATRRQFPAFNLEDKVVLVPGVLISAHLFVMCINRGPVPKWRQVSS